VLAAQAIGLTLHELATNAGKYGALSVNAGRVDVGWQFDGEIFAMSWTERNDRSCLRRSGVVSAARLLSRWRNGPSTVKSRLITRPPV
jgi:two-component sensor histidine kinase